MSTFADNYVLSFFGIQISSSAKLKHEVRAHVTNVNRKYPVFLEFMIDNTIHNNCCVNKVRIQHRKQVNDGCGVLLICFRYSELRARRLLLLMVRASRGYRVGR